MMTTSGTATFNLDLAELVEEAFERCGVELRTGYDLKTARRSLNLLTVEWANRGINLWTIQEGSIPLTANTIVYPLPVDTIDLLDHVVRTGTGQNQIDINITRISETTYSTIPNKNATGRPIQVWVNRQQSPTINIWPTPPVDNYYTFVYWRLRRIQDAGSGGTATQDIPFRFLPCMVAGLAYYLSMKLPSVDPQRRVELKAEYEQQFQLAADEDREKASIRLAPRVGYVGGGGW
jgi:hypothetical protein